MLAVLHTYLLNYNTPPGFLSVPIPSVLFFFSCLNLSLLCLSDSGYFCFWGPFDFPTFIRLIRRDLMLTLSLSYCTTRHNTCRLHPQYPIPRIVCSHLFLASLPKSTTAKVCSYSIPQEVRVVPSNIPIGFSSLPSASCKFIRVLQTFGFPHFSQMDFVAMLILHNYPEWLWQ